MSNLAEDKYRIASMILVLSKLTVTDLLQRLELERAPDAVYTVLGELLEKELLEVSHQTRLIFNQESRMLDEVPMWMYQVIPGKQQGLEQYVVELDRLRLQPDAQGKPQGLNYRVLEQLVEDVIAHPDKLQEEEVAIEQYLALAQSDEMSEGQSDLHQRAISEAYLRTLHGEYLWAKEQWSNAILQFLSASRLFAKNSFPDKRRAAELRACEIYITQYAKVKQNQPYLISDSLLEFIQSTDQLLLKNIEISAVETPVFHSLSTRILNEAKNLRNIPIHSLSSTTSTSEPEWEAVHLFSKDFFSKLSYGDSQGTGIAELIDNQLYSEQRTNPLIQ